MKTSDTGISALKHASSGSEAVENLKLLQSIKADNKFGNSCLGLLES